MAKENIEFDPENLEDATGDGGEDLDGASSGESHGYLDSRYKVRVDSVIEELGTEFAKACEVKDSRGGDYAFEIYALIFDKNFPVRLEVVDFLRNTTNHHILQVLDYGKISLSATKSERFVVILEKPNGPTLRRFITEKGALKEPYVGSTMVDHLLSAIHAYRSVGLVHGSINPDTIYYDEGEGKFVLRESVSSFCGYNQHPAYEALERLECHPAGKGAGSPTADFYALGMVTLYALMGKELYNTDDRDIIIKNKFENGSQYVIESSIKANKVRITSRMQNLIKGLIHDIPHDRYMSTEVRSWLRKHDTSPAISKAHKQTSSAFTFDDREYFSQRYLAYDIFRKWSFAKQSLRIADISRWVALALKRTELSEKIGGISDSGVVLSDEKVTKLVMFLDVEGPIRYKETCCTIYGIGTLLAYAYIKGQRDIMQNTAAMFNDGVIEAWIKLQPDPDMFNFSNLGWSIKKIKAAMRKRDMGFGMERALYETNRTLPCQSNIVQSGYVTNLDDLLNKLNAIPANAEADPLDRHISSFIASKIDLMDEIRIQNIQGFPYVAENQQALMIGLLTMAQTESGVKEVKSLTGWMADRLQSLVDKLHSKIIKKEMKAALKSAASDGRFATLFKVISDPSYISRDFYGFHEAKNQYHALAYEIVKIQKQSNIQRQAYQMGLRIAVSIGYFVAIVTLLFVLLQSS